MKNIVTFVDFIRSLQLTQSHLEKDTLTFQVSNKACFKLHERLNRVFLLSELFLMFKVKITEI